MTDAKSQNPENTPPANSGTAGVVARAGMQAAGGAIPFLGGVLSAIAGAWGEHEQKKAYDFLAAWMKMLEDEMKEKQRVIGEIMLRLDLQDDKINERVKSDEYQKLLRKAFRNWSGAESRKKQDYIRNVLSNAAAAEFVTDDVVSLFLEWLQKYSEFHFDVIAQIYENPSTSRAEIWELLGKDAVREDSAEADLFKLLMSDLSIGRVIRQFRETDGGGNFMRKAGTRTRNPAPATMKSAFDDKEQYVLTALGQQFVHYAMTELPTKIAYQAEEQKEDESSSNSDMAA